MTLKKEYRNDIAIRSSALKSSSGLPKERRVPAVHEWLGTTESYYEAKASGFPDEELRGNWSKFREKGPRSVQRKAIKGFTKNGVSRQPQVHAT